MLYLVSGAHRRNLILGRMGKLFRTAWLLLVLMLELVPAQVTHTLIPEDGQIKAVGFLEVLARSSCQPMDQLVGLEQEFPWEVEYLYRPSSVLVRRCSGCCGDEGCECRPITERNITLNV
ncbi:vascular endothelial growth factor A-like [Nothobranchius furzeri]|uniref:Vascular endothelial growth factor A-like n=1 Tax=Nothobranchius furzeri TaxID=105023 RepID=A0A9D2Z2J1_NOTFU|nr:vascular endothelial growth factor A-like [Nothobranchius furzeri]